jgi:hypothetical protein
MKVLNVIGGIFPKRRNRMKKYLVFLCVLILFWLNAFAEIEIRLKKTFIDDYKNKVTIEATNFIVVKAHKKPNSPSKDGDLHVAGMDSGVGLPIVAEIMNAASFQSAVSLIHSIEGTNNSIDLIGVWRIWCEHAGDDSQIQGDPFTITNTNPPHVFQIHPVTKLDNIDVLDSFRPVYGYEYKDAEDAFYRFENTECKIVPEDTYITIVTKGVGYNYVDFKIELLEDPYKYRGSEDGRFVFCRVLGLDDEVISQKERMVFVRNSKPDKTIEDMKVGDVLRVIGIPRINLNLLSWRVNEVDRTTGEYNNNKNKENEDKLARASQRLSWKLPYEMIIAAIVE